MGPSPHVAVRVTERVPSGTVYDVSVYELMPCVPLTLRVCVPVSVPDRPAVTRSPVHAEDCTAPFKVIAPSLAVGVNVIVTTEPTSYKVVVGERESPTLARVRVGLLVGNKRLSRISLTGVPFKESLDVPAGIPPTEDGMVVPVAISLS